MKYNLKKTKTADKENIKHLLTVLYCMFSTADEYLEEAKNKAIGDNEYYEKSNKEWEKAEAYLKGYIEELFKQIN